MPRLPAFCIDGRADIDGHGAALSFSVAEQALSASDYKLGGTSGPDGRIRVCGLQPGDYELTADEDLSRSAGRSARFGVSSARITDS